MWRGEERVRCMERVAWKLTFSSVQFSHSVMSNSLRPHNSSTPGLPVHHRLPEFTQTHVHWVGDTIQPSHPCRPLLLPPSIFPSIKVFSNESALCVRWPKYWSFSFSIIPSNEHPGVISFSMDWLDLLAVHRYYYDYKQIEFQNKSKSVCLNSSSKISSS